MPTNLLPRRAASEAALVLAVAALAFVTTLWIGGMLRSDEPRAAPSRVTLRVELPAADALPGLAAAPRRTASTPASASTSPAATPPPAVASTAVPPPAVPPPPPASSQPEEEVGHSSTP